MHGSESDLATLENLWDKIRNQTLWQLQNCYISQRNIQPDGPDSDNRCPSVCENATTSHNRSIEHDVSEKTNSSLLINDAHHNQSPPSSPIVVLNDDVTQVENNNHEPESANNSSVAIDSEAAPGKNSSSFLGVTPEVTTNIR